MRYASAKTGCASTHCAGRLAPGAGTLPRRQALAQGFAGSAALLPLKPRRRWITPASPRASAVRRTNLSSSVRGRQRNPFRLRDTDERLFEQRPGAASDAAKKAVQFCIGGAAVLALGAVALEGSQAQ